MAFDLLNILNIAEKINKSAKEFKENKLFDKLFYLECRHNLDLINCLNFEKAKYFDEDVKSIIRNLDTSIIEVYFIEKVRTSSIYKDIIDKIVSDKDFKGRLFENIYLKIKVLKKIVDIPKKDEGLKKIRFTQRLNNFRKLLLELIKSIDLQTKN